MERRTQLPSTQLHPRQNTHWRRCVVLPFQLQSPGIVGLAKIASAAYPDESQFDPNSDYYDPKANREQPRWYLVDIAFERKLARTITLENIKQHAETLGEGFPLITRGNRLSVFPVTTTQWKLLLSLE